MPIFRANMSREAYDLSNDVTTYLGGLPIKDAIRMLNTETLLTKRFRGDDRRVVLIRVAAAREHIKQRLKTLIKQNLQTKSPTK